jgi:hypothetical protein
MPKKVKMLGYVSCRFSFGMASAFAEWGGYWVWVVWGNGSMRWGICREGVAVLVWYVQGKENKRLIGLLPAACYTEWRAEVARVLAVVLGGEDEGG